MKTMKPIEELDIVTLEMALKIFEAEYKELVQSFQYVSRDKYYDIYFAIDKKLCHLDTLVYRFKRAIKNHKDNKEDK